MTGEEAAIWLDNFLKISRIRQKPFIIPLK